MQILTAVHKRLEVFEIFLAHLPNYPLAVIGDSQPHYDLLMQYRPDAYWIECENKPLGRKWNQGLKWLKGKEWDYLFITGSDDVYTPGLFQHYEGLKGKFHYAGLLDFYFTDFNRVRYCPGFIWDRQGEPHGAGRMIHRNVVNALDNRLWDDGINSGLDASMTRRLNQFKNLKKYFFRCRELNEIALDIKTEGLNLQSMHDYPGEWLDKEILSKILTKCYGELQQ